MTSDEQFVYVNNTVKYYNLCDNRKDFNEMMNDHEASDNEPGIKGSFYINHTFYKDLFNDNTIIDDKTPAYQIKVV